MERENREPTPTKAIPASPVELEAAQRYFKFNSPVQKYKTASPPMAGERWKLEHTLPSGVVLLLGHNSFMGDVKERLRSALFGEEPEPEFDERPYLNDVERFKSEDSRRSIQLRNTYSVVWHPKLSRLATAGDGNIARVWDAMSGEAVTKRTSWHTASPGETLCWSSGGELLLSGEDVYDGNTGRLLHGLSETYKTSYFRYSGHKYANLRGYNITPVRASHLSSTNNFSPWRPNSEQLIFGDYEKNLILRNGRTGEVEKVIDCDVASYITDFAWHPKGRFIAVTFEEHNVRIIDVDDAKIVDDLSVQHLLGWNPDGKILVARRERAKDDFVIWDALETRESSMPEEMKGELWFKRFFKNISADGQRYIETRRDGENVYSTGIFSTANDESVATLPGSITSAAWSSVDGGLLAICDGSETKVWKI